ncbi:MAG: ABC transporter ATP-binding protein [Mycoplasmatales bacterium]
MIKLNNITKKYSKQIVLDNFSLEVRDKEFIAIMGKSGAGKTTLLNILAGIADFTVGSYILDEVEVNKLSKTQKSELRSSKIGYIVQNYGLLNEITVEENIKICDKLFKRELATNFEEIVKILEINDIISKKPLAISGGQRQRVAIARAVYNKPQVLLMDEPTGNLDSDTAKKVMELIKNIQKYQEIIIILVTHDITMANYADRIVEL